MLEIKIGIEACGDYEKVLKYKYKCTTHPHQIYIEFLSEHGFLGTLILLSAIFSLIFKNIKKFYIHKTIFK